LIANFRKAIVRRHNLQLTSEKVQYLALAFRLCDARLLFSTGLHLLRSLIIGSRRKIVNGCLLRCAVSRSHCAGSPSSCGHVQDEVCEIRATTDAPRQRTRHCRRYACREGRATGIHGEGKTLQNTGRKGISTEGHSVWIEGMSSQCHVVKPSEEYLPNIQWRRGSRSQRRRKRRTPVKTPNATET
jgi:hypothetical protein